MAQRRISIVTLGLLAACLACASAHAQVFRAYLDASGSDANPCTLAQPCRLLPAALAAVASGGEIWLLRSANYNTGPVSIGKSVTILAVPGAVGSVVALGGDALVIATAGVRVALRNLVIVPFPGGGGTNGINMSAGDSLTIEDCLVANLPQAGVSVSTTAGVQVTRTTIRGNGSDGLRLLGGAEATVTRATISGNGGSGVLVLGSTGGTTTTADIANSTLDANSRGVYALSQNATAMLKVSVRRSRALRNGNDGIAATSEAGASVTLSASSNMLSNNGTGLALNGAGSIVWASGNTVSDNGIGWSNTAGLLDSQGDNTVRNNGENVVGLVGAPPDGLFVAADGSDANPGTAELPLREITTGIARAVSAGKQYVVISNGSYTGPILLNTASQGVNLYGGYVRASGWARNFNRATVSGPHTGTLAVDGVTTPTIVEYLSIVSASATSASLSSTAIVVNNSTGFQPRNITATAGSGANGQLGTLNDQTGDDGRDGTKGADGFEDDAGFLCASATDPPLAYAGGASCIGATSSTKGGDGRRGCLATGTNCAGTNGDAGTPNPGGTAGDGGAGVVGSTGGNGRPGQNGANGANGASGSSGVIFNFHWEGNPGGFGARGVDGTGGGGGAGGGSTHALGTCYDWGGGGGGGGSGGCGGGGAIGGTGGGGSIAILLVNSSVTALNVSVVTGDGGRGGSGRDGWSGGLGGLGKAGGLGNDESFGGGSGGNGGSGGRGGHGGGGAGGWVVGVYRSGVSTWSDSGTSTFTLGSVGAGGGSSGIAGTAGSRLNVYP